MCEGQSLRVCICVILLESDQLAYHAHTPAYNVRSLLNLILSTTVRTPTHRASTGDGENKSASLGLLFPLSSLAR